MTLKIRLIQNKNEKYFLVLRFKAVKIKLILWCRTGLLLKSLIYKMKHRS